MKELSGRGMLCSRKHEQLMGCGGCRKGEDALLRKEDHHEVIEREAHVKILSREMI